MKPPGCGSGSGFTSGWSSSYRALCKRSSAARDQALVTHKRQDPWLSQRSSGYRRFHIENFSDTICCCSLQDDPRGGPEGICSPAAAYARGAGSWYATLASLLSQQGLSPPLQGNPHCSRHRPQTLLMPPWVSLRCFLLLPPWHHHAWWMSCRVD